MIMPRSRLFFILGRNKNAFFVILSVSLILRQTVDRVESIDNGLVDNYANPKKKILGHF